MILLLAPQVASAAEVRIAHGRGETVLADTPRRVAVFDLASLDTLRALDVEVDGVPNARFPAYLSQYGDDRYAKIGTLFEPDMQALAALAPDLIIVGGRSRNAYGQLSALAPTIDLSIDPTDFVGSVMQTAITLGEIFSVQDEAERLTAELGVALADLHAKAADQGTSLMVFGVNDNVSGQAPGSRFGIVHDVVGLPSVMPASDPQTGGGTRPEPNSAEAQALRERTQAELGEALAADPDWLLVLDRGAAFGKPGTIGQVLAARPEITGTTAWQSQQVIYLDAPSWYLVGGGLDAIRNTVGQVSAAFDAAN